MQKTLVTNRAYRMIKCPICELSFKSFALVSAYCRRCKKRFNVETFTEKEIEKIEPVEHLKTEFVDDITEIAEKKPLTALLINPITQLPEKPTVLDQKFIDVESEEVQTLLSLFQPSLDKLNFKIDDIKKIVEKLNKIAVKRHWLDKIGTVKDNEDEVDLFFLIYEKIANAIQNRLQKEDLKEKTVVGSEKERIYEDK